MGEITTTAATVYRNGTGSPHKPVKADIRALFALIDDQLQERALKTETIYFVPYFTSIATTEVPEDKTYIQTSAYSEAALNHWISSEAVYIYDEDIDAAYVTANPGGAAVLDANGRGFRLASHNPIPEMFGATGDGTANDLTALRNCIWWSGKRGLTFSTPGRYYFNAVLQTYPSTAFVPSSTQSNFVWDQVATTVKVAGTIVEFTVTPTGFTTTVPVTSGQVVLAYANNSVSWAGGSRAGSGLVCGPIAQIDFNGGLPSDLNGHSFMMRDVSILVTGDHNSSDLIRIAYEANGLGRLQTTGGLYNVVAQVSNPMYRLGSYSGLKAAVRLTNIRNFPIVECDFTGDTGRTAYPTQDFTATGGQTVFTWATTATGVMKQTGGVGAFVQVDFTPGSGSFTLAVAAGAGDVIRAGGAMVLPESVAIITDGADSPVSVLIDNCKASGFYAPFVNRASGVGSGFEGMIVQNNTVTNSAWGVDDNSEAQEPLLRATGNDFTTYLGGFRLRNRVLASITNNNLIGFWGPWVAIDLDNDTDLPPMSFITNNVMMYIKETTQYQNPTNPQVDTIVVRGTGAGGDMMVVGPNSHYAAAFSTIRRAVWLTSEANNVLVPYGIYSSNVTTWIQNDGTNNTILSTIKMSPGNIAKVTDAAAFDAPFYTYGGTDVASIKGTGSPEGVVAGGRGSDYTDIANGNVYSKTTTATNTGWRQLAFVP